MIKQFLKDTDPELYNLIQQETQRQAEGLELIASENYASAAVREALGSVLTNKYSEGYPGKRYYAGNQIIDSVETLAIDRAKQLFQAEHVNVQPLSGGPANIAAYFALLEPGDTVMGLSLDQGGHLSHGHPLNFSGRLFQIVPYFVDKQTERIDMADVRRLARQTKPKMILAGFSAYSRNFDWPAFAEIAAEVGAITMADIAHIAGLIAGQQLDNPVPYFDVVTTTTHKTLRGPRGGLIMCKEQFAKAIDRAVFPGIQGGPHDHVTAAKAVAFGEALQPDFKQYAAQVIQNAKSLASALAEKGFRIVTGGTDNHLLLIDVFGSKKRTGKEAETILDQISLSTNKNMIPFDTRKPLDPSGIRLGTAAITTRGMNEPEMIKIAGWIDQALAVHDDTQALTALRLEVEELCRRFPIPGLNQ
ncbi:MAG: serine hydroxymethyltransferase [Patescibacteria group bacterium]